jgi:tetratricopeptide (TPR) repeat protein
LQDWPAAAADYLWILERQPDDASALYNLGNVRGSEGDWNGARDLYGKASLARPGFAMARSSEALAAWQEGDLAWAELELRKLIRRYPLFADARAALSGLLWRQGSSGEAESNWAAAAGLDQRYRQADWLVDVRRWPPQPTQDLMAFLALEKS